MHPGTCLALDTDRNDRKYRDILDKKKPAAKRRLLANAIQLCIEAEVILMLKQWGALNSVSLLLFCTSICISTISVMEMLNVLTEKIQTIFQMLHISTCV